jgi:hypothetical protein
MFSSGLFPGVCRLNAKVSDHSVWSIFIIKYEDGTECSEMLAFKLQTPANHPEEHTTDINLLAVKIQPKSS